MSTVNFSLFKSLFGQLSEEQQGKLYAEILFMVLSGAARADFNIESVETGRIRDLLKKLIGKDFTEKEIYMAGETEFYETLPIQRCVARASSRLTLDHRQSIVEAMIEVFQSDGKMGALEADYFNSIVSALNLTPAEILKL